MIFIIPFIIGAIGLAVGAVSGASIAHASREKDKQEAKHHRKVANELSDKYSKLQKQYYDLEDKSKSESKRLMKKLAMSEVEKDTLHLVVELQQAVIGLMLSIDESPSYDALTQMNTAVKATNQVLSHLNKNPIQISPDYFARNFERVISIEESNNRELIAEDLHTSTTPTLNKPSRDLFGGRKFVLEADELFPVQKDNNCLNLVDEAGKNLSYPQQKLQMSTVKYGSQVSIKACNKKYVMSRLNRHGKIAARAKHMKQWEMFKIISAEEPFSDNESRPVSYGERIAFRSIANDKFVSSDLGNYGRLIAGAPHVREWETFTLLPVQDDEKLGRIIEYGEDFTLQIHDKKIVYCRVKESGRICIDSNRSDGSEVFTFIKPSN